MRRGFACFTSIIVGLVCCTPVRAAVSLIQPSDFAANATVVTLRLDEVEHQKWPGTY